MSVVWRGGLKRPASTILVAALFGWPAVVGARDDGAGDDQPASAAESIESGAIASSAMAARSDAQRAVMLVEAGWDHARRSALFESTAEAGLGGRFALRAGAHYASANEVIGPSIELRIDALRQERHGLDLAMAAGYEGRGFNGVPAATLRAAVGGASGGTTLLANLVYGQGLELGERYGEARAAGWRRISRRVFVGGETHALVDLERDTDEPEGELDRELSGGLVLTYSLGRVALTGSAGVNAFTLRADRRTRVGPVGTMGLGLIF
jgi:hypothetical protein